MTDPSEENGLSGERYTFDGFRGILRTLRGEDGCPWDRKQTFASLKPTLIDETVEVMAAIDLFSETGDAENLCEELGDVLLHVFLMAQIAEEQGLFTVEDVVQRISRKMIRRHPHVFGGEVSDWDAIKRKEKAGKDPALLEREEKLRQRAVSQALGHLQEAAERDFERKSCNLPDFS